MKSFWVLNKSLCLMTYIVDYLRFFFLIYGLSNGLNDKSGVDKIIVKKQSYQPLNTNHEFFLKDKSGVDKIIVKKQSYQLLNTNHEFFLKDKSGVDKIIVKKQSYQLLNANREFFQVLMPRTFINWTINLRKLGQIDAMFYFVRVCEGAMMRLAM